MRCSMHLVALGSSEQRGFDSQGAELDNLGCGHEAAGSVRDLRPGCRNMVAAGPFRTPAS